ncbi:MAG TPA: SRPBCC family protein [Vicinamibacterales bacterium]|nr:SRPBCC family protein [Vicinamibacterales bacterium]
MAAVGARNSDTFKVSTPEERTIVLTRVFDAPRDLVFEAMTRPEHIRRWWGQLGDGYSVPVCEVDFRVGGKWRFVNQHPKGQAEFYGEYREIAPPGKVVFTEIFAPFPDAASVVSAILTEENGRTRLTATCTYPSAEVRDMVLKTGMEKGAALSYDRLEEVALELAGV